MIAMQAPLRWRNNNRTAQRQRAMSMPSYVLAMQARDANHSGGGELFLAGTSLPTLVYYSGMHCNFVETSELEHVELVGADYVPDAINYHDLILLDSSGRAEVIGNLDREWHWTRDYNSLPYQPATLPAQPLQSGAD